jgi:coproporphyrinogen III oxidase-like Fe-S oxidoreductase
MCAAPLATHDEKALEAVLLGLRVREGLELASLSDAGASSAQAQAAHGRVVVTDGRVRLTRHGRLFADAVARELSA